MFAIETSGAISHVIGLQHIIKLLIIRYLTLVHCLSSSYQKHTNGQGNQYQYNKAA